MRVTARLDGDMRAVAREMYEDLEIAVTRAVDRAGLGLKEELRAQVYRAGLGRRVANAWRNRTFPDRGASASAAAVVSSRAPMLARAFDEGATIRSKSGLFLAVPSDAAPKRGRGGKRINPSNFPEVAYGRLRFVYRDKGPSMLVVDNQRVRTGKRPGFVLSKSKRALATGMGLSTVPMFFLFPQVRLRKRLDVAGAARRWVAFVPPLIDEEAARVARWR